MELIAKDITIEVDGSQLVRHANLILSPHEFVAILGPNGAGKTSLLRAALGFEKLKTGMVILGGEDVHGISPIERAQRVSYLPQIRPLAWPNIVRDVVALGRYSHGANLGKLKGMDADAVDAAIAACDIAHLGDRKTDTLSGGELARVHCARAFAAQAPLLIADEPVAALDPRHQYRVMELIRNYVDESHGALVVLHDVDLAARYADRLVWMKEGEIIADGPPSETLTESRMAEIYGVKAKIMDGRVLIEGAT